MLKKIKKENEYTKKALELMLFCKMAEKITTAEYKAIKNKEGSLLKVGYCKKLFGCYNLYVGQKTKKMYIL
jgi:hypothetical protein